MATRELSPYLDLLEPKDKTRGQRSYDPRQIYRYIFDNSDRYGIIIYTQKELAEAIKIQRETMNYFFLCFIDLGLIEKVGVRKFQVLVHPDEFEWTDEVFETLARLRKRHQVYYKNKTVE